MNIGMKKIFYLMLSLSFIACQDMIETYPNGQINDEEMLKHQEYVSGLIGYAYEQLPRDYRNIEGNRLDCATDDAVLTSTTDNVVKFATGNVNNSQDPFQTVWASSYKAISNLNRFLNDSLFAKTDFYFNPELNRVYKERLLGEAYGLRAFLYWKLLKFWGGKGISSGEMLGVPLVTKVFTPESEDYNLKRNTYAECVEQIKADCDSAYKYLPIAHRDFLVEDLNVYKDVLGSCNWGRIDGITTRAILSDMYLTYASPLFAPDDVNKRNELYALAAYHAKEVLDFKSNVDNVSGGFVPTNRLDWFDPTSPNCVFVSRRAGNSDAHDSHERDFYPGGFNGNGTLGATMDLVDAFPMENGYPITEQDGNYDKDKPFNGRDKRLYSVIFYPGSKNKENYTFETWFDEATNQLAKDAPGQPNVSRTGFHIKKMVFQDLNWADSKPIKAPHVKHYYRWENMLLNYAEAVFEYTGSASRPFTYNKKTGMSAMEAIALIRSRNTYDNELPYVSTNPDRYLVEASENQAKFRELIHNERRIEFCFEGVRFFDIRRWNTDVAEINKPVHKISVVKKADGTFEYNKEEVEVRNFPSLYVPIPYSEILRADNMEQNEGWTGWSK